MSWRFVIAIVLASAVFLAAGVYLGGRGVTPDELAQASVEGCQGQNAVREVLRQRIMGDIIDRLEQMAQDITIDPALFPDIPPDRFAELLAEGVKIDGNRIAFNADQLPLTHPADCVERYLGDQ